VGSAIKEAAATGSADEALTAPGGFDILIIDDERANVLVLERILRQAGITALRGTTDPHEGLALFAERPPDLLLLDLHMPALDGFAVLEQLAPALAEDPYLPVLVLSGAADARTRQRVLASGAKDFVSKPFDRIEVVLRIRNLLETRRLHLALRQQNTLLEERVRERTADLEASWSELLERLCRAGEFRDDDTGEHTRRVGTMTERVARALGIADDDARLMGAAAQLHDLGKIGISDTILLKPGRLTPEEMAVMRTHATIGAAILAASDVPLLQLAEQIAASHHERWDGAGYPAGLAGERIPLPARIVAAVDVMDALTHDRPYRLAMTWEAAVGELHRGTGAHFDPRVVEAYLAVRSHDVAAGAGT